MPNNTHEQDDYTIQLLNDYDEMRANLRVLEHNLNKQCAEYGRRRGLWGYRPEHLRIALVYKEQAA